MRNKFATELRSKSDPHSCIPCREILSSGDFTFEICWDFFNWPEEYLGYQVCGVYCDGNRLYATTRCDDCPIAVFDLEGNFIQVLGTGIPKGRVHGISMDANGYLWFADDGKHVLRCIDENNNLIETLGQYAQPSDTGYDASIPGHLSYLSVTYRGEPFNKPTRIIQAPDGCYYVSDGYGNAAIHKFSAERKLLFSWGAPGTGQGEFSIVHSVIADNRGRILVSDRDNDRVQLFDTEGNFLTSIDGLLYPCDVAVDERYIYVGENDGRISIFDMDLHLLSQIGHSGSGLRSHSITADQHGNLYIGSLHGNYNLIKLKRIQ